MQGAGMPRGLSSAVSNTCTPRLGALGHWVTWSRVRALVSRERAGLAGRPALLAAASSHRLWAQRAWRRLPYQQRDFLTHP